jgi:hypothetical protein
VSPVRLFALLTAALAPAPPFSPSTLPRVSRERLQVTEGTITTLASGQLTTAAPKMRAVIAAPCADSAELRFRYQGPAAELKPLAYGVARRQIGLKLRAQDACNLVYVMWRLDPKSGLEVSVKRNPGQSRSSECGPAGYRKVGPLTPLPPLLPGESHALGAELLGDLLTVRVDGARVWQGSLGEEVRGLAGPVGVRTDNVRVDFDLGAKTP